MRLGSLSLPGKHNISSGSSAGIRLVGRARVSVPIGFSARPAGNFYTMKELFLDLTRMHTMNPRNISLPRALDCGTGFNKVNHKRSFWVDVKKNSSVSYDLLQQSKIYKELLRKIHFLMGNLTAQVTVLSIA